MDDLDGVEIMPRPPAAHRPVPTAATVPAALATPSPSLAGAGAGAMISEQLRIATALHERFLAAQAGRRVRRPEPMVSPVRTVVDLKGWYLDRAGRMTAGAVLNELLSLLPHHDGMLDWDVTFLDSLPAPGDELLSSLTGNGPMFHGEVEGRLSVRVAPGDMPAPAVPPAPLGDAFDAHAVTAFAEGRPADCFTGPRWAPMRAHVRSPGVGSRRTLLLKEITGLAPSTGLTATGRPLPPAWQTPAALLEGCYQALSFHLTAAGRTIHRDGWRFEPLPDAPCRIRCHGNALDAPDGVPQYHVVVRSLTDTTVHADAVCTIDGRVVLRAEGLAVRLTPDTPLPHWRRLGPPAVQRTGDPIPPAALAGLRGHDDPAAATVDHIRYDHAAMLTAAWGPMTEVFPGTDDEAFRLPGPPYLFITRVTEVSAPLGDPRPGSRMIAEYDVPAQVWFREQSGTVPVAALMEVALQPCGFLAGHLAARTTDSTLCIRNLDGRLTTVGEVPAGVRTLRTTVEFVGLDRWDGTVLERFRTSCVADGILVLEGTAVFALTPTAQPASRTGLPVTDADRARLAQPCDRPTTDLRSRPAPFFGHSARLPGPMLLMLDRITGYWPDGGPAGLGRLRAECDVRADAWYFKAHFFKDPVQPGSLGVEAMHQLLCCYLVERGVADGFRFEPVVPDSWTYRGQVLPSDTLVTIEVDVLRVELGAHGGHAEGEAWLWVDGHRVYHVPRLKVRVVPGAPDSPSSVDTALDPRSDTWLADHCPTWTVPAVPLMSTADLLARAAGDRAGRPVRVLRDLRVQRWLPVTGPTRLRTTCAGDTARLAVWHEAGELSRFAPVATATVGFEPPPRVARFNPLPDPVDMPDPYEAADLFHGRSFQFLTTLRMGAAGSSGVLDAGRGSVPRGALHQGLLDAALHVIPHNDLSRWDRAVEPGRLAFPHRLTHLTVFEPLPNHGEIEVEARYGGMLPDDLVAVDIQLCRGEHVLVAFQVVNMLVPAGPLAVVSGADRRAYLRDGRPDCRLLLTGPDGILRRRDIERIDVLRGTANAVYGLPAGTRATDWLPHIALKEHIARTTGVHPSTVEVGCLDDVSWDADHAAVRTT